MLWVTEPKAVEALSAQVEQEYQRPVAERLLVYFGRYWLFFFLAGLIVYFSLTTPHHAFFGTNNFKTIALDTSEVIMLAIGETFVIVTAGIDLSVGGILLFSGVAGGTVMLKLSGTTAQTASLQYPHDAVAVPIGVLVIIATSIVLGLFNGVLVTMLRLPPFIVTLGTLGMFFGAADLISGGTNISAVPSSFQDKVGNGKIVGLFVPVVIALGFVIVTHILLRYTRFGRYTAAIGSNQEASRRVGITVDRHLIKVYTLAGFCAGVAAMIDLSRFGSINLAAHNTDNLNAIAAVVIGGTSLFGGIGTILGTVVGAFIPTVLQNGFIIQGVDPFWQELLVGATIIVAVYLDQLRRRRLS
jgi:ribose transport system permease protein